MKILHLTHTDINSDSRILKEIQSLAKKENYKLFGIGIERNDERKSSNSENNITIHSLEIKSRNINLFSSSLKYIIILIEFYIKIFLLALKIKPNVIHCHDIGVLPIGAIIKIFIKSKLIYDAHELESKKNGISIREGKFIFFLEKLLWKYIDNLIIVSPSIKKWYRRAFDNKKSDVIMNSPILKDYSSSFDSAYLRNKFNIEEGKKIFIYVGLLSKGRGIEILLDIFKMDDIESHIVFLGYGELDEEILKMSDLHNNIHLHNSVSHEKVVPIAKSADVGLCFIQNISLSDYYCLPNKLFEYAFSGIPVLASDFPDIKKVVNRYKLGKCSSMTEKSMYETIKEFESMEKIEKIEVSLDTLTWNAQEEKIHAIYQEI